MTIFSTRYNDSVHSEMIMVVGTLRIKLPGGRDEAFGLTEVLFRVYISLYIVEFEKSPLLVI